MGVVRVYVRVRVRVRVHVCILVVLDVVLVVSMCSLQCCGLPERYVPSVIYLK